MGCQRVWGAGERWRVQTQSELRPALRSEVETLTRFSHCISFLFIFVLIWFFFFLPPMKIKFVSSISVFIYLFLGVSSP